MTFTLELPDALAKQLQALPTEKVSSVHAAALDAIEEQIQAQPEQIKTGAQLVDFWKRNGLIGFRSDIKDTDAEYARLREKSNTREQEG